MRQDLSLSVHLPDLAPLISKRQLSLCHDSKGYNLHVPAEVHLTLEGEHKLLATSSNKQMFNTFKSLLSNLLEGFKKPYQVEITLIGTGYKVAVDESRLTFKLGFSHEVYVDLPASVSCKSTSDKRLTLTSADKQALGIFASRLERLKYPNPYFGTGVYIKDKQYRKKKMRKV